MSAPHVRTRSSAFTRSSDGIRSARRAWPACVLVLLLLAGLLVLVLAPATAGARTIKPQGTVTIVWDQSDLANVQLANGVMVLPIAPMAITPISNSVKFTSTISGGSVADASPYWGQVRFRGGIRFLKLTPAATWTQVTVTKLMFNIKMQSVRASINGQPPVDFAGVNEMGMTDEVFWSHGHKFVRIQGASLSYTPESAAALKAAFGYTVPDAPQPFASLTEVIRLK
jgi:hypothetical protein